MVKSQTVLFALLLQMILPPLFQSNALAQSMPDMTDPAVASQFMDRVNAQIKANPNDAASYVQRAMIYHMLKHYNESITDCLKAIELHYPTFEVYDILAFNHALLNDWASTIKDCNAALSRNPKDFAAYANRALAYSEKRQYTLAMKDALMSLQLDRKQPTAYEMVGEICYKTRQYQRALDYLNRAVSMDDTMGDAFYYRGETQNALGKQNEAYKDIARSKQLRYTPGEISTKQMKQ
ncbi:MAG TPA: tetratricopeptide repeat protein [Planktothrix sp.]|jgi:tetratricopeptide (TPR) repeat protein